MPQIINTNVASLTAQRNLNSSQNSLSTSLQRLSSGMRINSARDDAAGLAISQRMPTRMLRLQRRDYYRLIVPPNPRLRCLIPSGESSGRMIEATVVDISGGGLAVVAPPSSLDLSVDSLIDQCQITLPEIGTITATLQVRNLFRVTERGRAELRAGCQFVGLPAAADLMIQRYILRFETERAAQEAD